METEDTPFHQGHEETASDPDPTDGALLLGGPIPPWSLQPQWPPMCPTTRSSGNSPSPRSEAPGPPCKPPTSRWAFGSTHHVPKCPEVVSLCFGDTQAGKPSPTSGCRVEGQPGRPGSGAHPPGGLRAPDARSGQRRPPGSPALPEKNTQTTWNSVFTFCDSAVSSLPNLLLRHNFTPRKGFKNSRLWGRHQRGSSKVTAPFADPAGAGGLRSRCRGP